LSPTHLRAYLKRLPDFDDIEAENRALDYAEKYKGLLQALSFLASWPALDRAANLVINRSEELHGDHYEILTPAANALAGKHPLAATLLLRAMIDSRSIRAGPAGIDMPPATLWIARASLYRSRISESSRRTRRSLAGCAQSMARKARFGAWFLELHS
jgi:hypothetical protein